MQREAYLGLYMVWRAAHDEIVAFGSPSHPANEELRREQDVWSERGGNMIDHDTSTAGPLSNNHARFGAAASVVTTMIYNGPVRTDSMASAASTEGVLVTSRLDGAEWLLQAMARPSDPIVLNEADWNSFHEAVTRSQEPTEAMRRLRNERG